MGALDCLHDVTIYLYYALCFVLIEHSVCHEPNSVLINVYIYLNVSFFKKSVKGVLSPRFTKKFAEKVS